MSNTRTSFNAKEKDNPPIIITTTTLGTKPNKSNTTGGKTK